MFLKEVCAQATYYLGLDSICTDPLEIKMKKVSKVVFVAFGTAIAVACLIKVVRQYSVATRLPNDAVFSIEMGEAADLVGDRHRSRAASSSQAISQVSLKYDDSPLRVVIQPKERWNEIAEVVAAWRTFAFDKELRACDEKFQILKGLGQVRPIEGQNEIDRLVCQYNWIVSLKAHPALPIADCHAMTLFINDALTGTTAEKFDTVLACHDLKDQIQAVALYNQEKNKLVCLVTHPDNINHEVNQAVENRVRGAGTSIMLYLFRETFRSGLPLTLDALSRSKAFYQKLQFEETGDWDPRSIHMQLTPGKILSLVMQKIPPFDKLEIIT